ncbi:hypothetical protein AB0F25_30675 [Streptomyces wedmorensis]|uniref:hypothetical protein n=1 Tax=Streptomyces wedmorensis TaxID=43759 RepID=UPI00342C26BF
MNEKPDETRNGARQPDPASVGLPVRVFLYTLDQVAMMLTLDENYLKTRGLVYYFGRSTGTPSRDQLQAKNIMPPGGAPDWRIAETELIRWCKRRNIKVYSRGWATA